ncbi:MAG: ADP-glyceromanno-heptose 6-epimerase [Leptospiraceae bacterium]|nr:ADP-glyceromanno-heptose 6-epimerase [Leptospiraceae bacterium]MCP5500900.1 ADP-glyceromanno-heptose 6-epimerase [Leptospiraceae bacterium]
MKKSRVIVTGGAGLIGSNIVQELNTSGEEDILIVDHLGTSEKWKNLSRLHFKDYMEKDDFLKKVQNGFLNSYTHVIHMGACSSTTEIDASYLIRNNYEYTKILAETCVENGIRFLYASSAATYGLGENGYDDKVDIFSLRPLNMYGYSKHLFDLYAMKTGLINKITGLKYFNVFGYGEFHKGDMRSVVLKGYEEIKKTGKLRLFRSYRKEYKDGEQKRDFLYVQDAARITLHLLSGAFYGIYNVGRGVAETWNSLGTAIFSALGIPENIEYSEMPEHLKEKYQYFTKSDTEKLLQTKYSQGFTPLSKAIGEYVKLLETGH